MRESFVICSKLNVMNTWLELSINELSISLVNKSFVYQCRTIYKWLYNVISLEFKIATILFFSPPVATFERGNKKEKEKKL